jgi:ATP-dependent Clp protease ATP-binding subunit ClpC
MPPPSNVLDLHSVRATKARLARKLGHGSYQALLFGEWSFGLLALGIWLAGETKTVALTSVGLGLTCFMAAQWYKHDLKPLPVDARSHDGTLGSRLTGEVLGRLPADAKLTPLALWDALADHWQTFFLLNHSLLSGKLMRQGISNNAADMAAVWQTAAQLADNDGRKLIEPGHIVTAIQLTAPGLQAMFAHIKYGAADIRDINNWLDRVLDLQELEKPFFGGIGRDWANGFTPTLNRFGTNLSYGIEHGGSNFGAMSESPGVAAMQNSFAQGAHAVALIGPDGIGKTSHVYALAQLLLEGDVVPTLQYNQIFGLTPSAIISSAQQPGELEQIVLTLLSEAVQAGHVILFLDDAQLFFSNGPGSFDLTRILLPILQSGQVRLIMAMDPSDYQRLRTHNSSFANLLSPVMLTERTEREVMDILEDSALGLEYSHKVIISYDAVREAYRLSGRYDSENAYPGKAISLLEQSLSHAEHGNIITAVSVQQAIEQSHGVKVGAAAAVEADQLLHLEDAIHERMINQVRAVKVVSAALRRSRAGVANPHRPIGSFLFLGPTGVGKTELAKAIASTYFRDEANMVRLDMSEYQQPDDVRRLLSNGQEETNSLILAVRKQPFTVVLLDEIEKAHPNILNLLLQMLDEGELTDTAGRKASFKDCIIICTSNAGADSIRQRIEQGQELESFEREFTDQLINSGQFKPELLNRFDEIVLFRPLKPEELAQVVRLMVKSINKTLANQNISVELSDAAVMKIVEVGNDPRLGARPMRRMLQRAVEDGIANRILTGQAQPGDHIMLDVGDLEL